MTGRNLPASERDYAPFEVKFASDAEGIVEGHLAAFHNVDLGRDVIEAGSFKKTLDEAQQFKSQHRSESLYPFLWQHQKDEPIGGIMEAREDPAGLYVKVKLNMGIE